LNEPSTATRSPLRSTVERSLPQKRSPVGTAKSHGSTVKLSGPGAAGFALNCRVKESGLPHGSVPPSPASFSTGVTPML
jgi:hypothetical protein